MTLLLLPQDPIESFQAKGGGKACNMARLSQMGIPVPEWFCIGTDAYDRFVSAHGLTEKLIAREPFDTFSEEVERLFLEFPLPTDLAASIRAGLEAHGLADQFVAVRSSGLDEDSPEYSFAGQFSSFLFQKGFEQIETSLKRCWASAFSERALSYRKHHGLPTSGLRVGVVVQKMVNAESSGVAFSRDPTHPLKINNTIVSAVWGLGEGLVSGELDADCFVVDRDSKAVESTLVTKPHALVQAPEGGLEKQEVSSEDKERPSLSDTQAQAVAELAQNLENALALPQDCEWAFENGTLYCLQTRPITTLPSAAYYDPTINGRQPILWDNSNIVESYCGVTSPLTFSFAASVYRQVYLQFCELIGVSEKIITEYEPVFRNMLGLVRGHIYYNLVNWYKLVVLLPGAAKNREFMDTMMGVKQELNQELASLFSFVENPPKMSLWARVKLLVLTTGRFIRIDRVVDDFFQNFTPIYNEARSQDFKQLSLPLLVEKYNMLETEVLRKWTAPIINDTFCMVTFGVLKKLTAKWLADDEESASLQNDLLCGQGDIESTEPTKMLMRLAAEIDAGDPAFRNWFIETPSTEVWKELAANHQSTPFMTHFAEFLDRYGFRCVNELKLEEKDLHDDPSFAINAIASYVRQKAYSIEEMEKREKAIRDSAEKKVRERLSGVKLRAYQWVLKLARKAIRHRENLRFARTKIFGVVRHLFRAIGHHLAALGQLEHADDVFYLELHEIFAFVEGRWSGGSLPRLAAERKEEFARYRSSAPPPDRFMTYGAAGISMPYLQLLGDADLLRDLSIPDDPNLLVGTPCSPGVVEGVVRVAYSHTDAEGLDGEILVTERTDPGWVPLYPSCSGLLIERGSLLSHSAVVARELGLPTIVSIRGGLMQKLETGMRVRMDAAKGTIEIL